eukprot:GGOE01018412.1.p1 GENE.GGOE01018412.1~~GGOE01018412.1.p1  ORF type:complete len:985 (+),score=336.01 GGOE01018412.1:29-2956(+)
MSETPEVWSFGMGSYGRLGHGDTTNQFSPSPLRALRGKPVVGVAAGLDHCLVWTSSNELLAFGRGSNGVLGLNDVQNRLAPTPVPGFSNKEIAGCAAGAAHSVVWTADKDVYVTGQGKEGALGLGDTSSRMSFTLLRTLSGKNIAGAACGDGHTVVWLADRGVYCFGQARYGQLGTGETANALSPVALPSFSQRQVLGASCGGSHTLLWTAEDVFACGYGKNGQLGLGDTNNQLTPTAIPALRGKPIAGAACGANHSVVWTTEGEVFTFGHGGNGRLGHGDTNHRLAPTPLPPFQQGQKVVGAACGPNHTFVWTAEGSIFSFGWGSYGQLGHGDTNHRTSPTLVAALKGKNITGVACGGATVIWSSTVPAKLKGLDQMAVHQLQTILQPPQKAEHPLTVAAMSALKETVTHKELAQFVTISESLAEMLPSTQEDGKESYLRLQLEKATQKRDAGLQRSDVVSVVEEERKIVDLRTQLLELAQEHPKRVASILQKAEDGLPLVLGLEEKVKGQQLESETALQRSEDDIERCKAVSAEESTKLTEAQLEVERLRRCLQDAELAVVRQQDQVMQADRRLAEAKAQHAAHRSVIQACENAQNVIQEAYEQRVDLKRQLSSILTTSQVQQTREEQEQQQYFSQAVLEFMERERYYLQRAEQAHRMIDPRLEKEMHSVSQVMGALVAGSRKALKLIPDAVVPTPSDAPTRSLPTAEQQYSTPLRGFVVPAAEDELSTGSMSPLAEAPRRSVLSVPKDKVGTRYQRLLNAVVPSVEGVIEGLTRYATAEELPKCARLMSEFREKLEDFEAAGDSPETSMAKATYWLYTTDSWVYERVNSALMNDSGIALSDLGPCIRVLLDGIPLLSPTLGSSGRLYKRLRLTEAQLAMYTEGRTFFWSNFVSLTTMVDGQEWLGRQLLVLLVPPDVPCVLNVTAISASHEEELVLHCYQLLRVVRVVRGATEYAAVDDVVEVEVVASQSPQ